MVIGFDVIYILIVLKRYPATNYPSFADLSGKKLSVDIIIMITIVFTGDKVKYQAVNILMVSYITDMAAREG